jgi:hypothetical protein
MSIITNSREESLSVLQADPEQRIQITDDLENALVQWNQRLQKAAQSFLRLTNHSVSFFSLTKSRYVDVLACEQYALDLYKNPESSAESEEMILGHLVDALVTERVTLESGFDKDLGCFPLPRLPERLKGECLTDEEQEAVLSHVEEIYRALEDVPTELGPETRSRLAPRVVEAACNIAQNFPLLKGSYMPRTQKSYKILLSGTNEPEVTLSGRVDLVIGSPPIPKSTTHPATARASTCILDIKSGKVSEDHRKENYFYALLEALATGVPPFRVATYYANSGSFETEPVDLTVLEHTVETVCKAIKRFGELLALDSPRLPSRNPQFRCHWCMRKESCAVSLASPSHAKEVFSGEEDDTSQSNEQWETEVPDDEEGSLKGSGSPHALTRALKAEGPEAPSASAFPLTREASLKALLTGRDPHVSDAHQASARETPDAGIQPAEMTQLQKDCKERVAEILERLGQHLQASLPTAQAGGTRLLTEWDFSLILKSCEHEASRFLNPEPSSFTWSPRLAKRSLSWHCLAQFTNAHVQDHGGIPPHAPRHLAMSAVDLSKCAFPRSLLANQEPETALNNQADSSAVSFPTPTRQKVLEWLEQNASEAERIASAALAHTMAVDLWHLVDFGRLEESGAKFALDGNPKDIYYSVERTAPVTLRARWFLEITLPASKDPSRPGVSYPQKVIVDSSTHPTTGSQFSRYELEGGFLALLFLLKNGNLPQRIVYLCPASGTSQVVKVDKGLLARTLDVLEGFADEVDRQASP